MTRNINRGEIPSDLGWLVDTLDDYEERLRTLEAPDGTQLAQTVATLQALVNDIQAQLDAYNASRWTNAQISSQITSQISSTLAGNVSVGGTLAVASTTTLSGEVYAPNAYGFDITYTRRTAWLGNDGRLGFASSSAKRKTAIQPVGDELLRILEAVPVSFFYRAEIARRTSLRINEGADYRPAREIGLLAEELDALGLGAFVIYDESGAPEGIEYGMLVVALLAVGRDHEARLRRLEGREG